MATIGFKAEGDAIWLIGELGSHLGQSLWLREINGREDGSAPSVDLSLERSRAEQVRALVAAGTLTAVHDVSDGGLLVALAEMGLAGGRGCALDIALDAAKAFGEDQGRYVVTAPAGRDVPGATRIGTVSGSSVAGVELAALREASDAFFRDWMEA